jgi:acetate kinase
MRVLVVNAGSSSLKLRVLDPNDEVAFARDLGPINEGDALAEALSEVGGVEAVGHRIVHGGTRFSNSVRIDETVRDSLGTLTDLAPLHQPLSLAALDEVSRIKPELPAVASFDTAFHVTLLPEAATYALPDEWRDRYGIKRYGFHGLSHKYAARRVAEILHRSADRLRLVTCHLGAGASLAAVKDGESVDTTMGFTPLEGLVMATRSGTIDPGLVLWLLNNAGLSVDDVADALEHRSGLKGLAGTADMSRVLAAANAGKPDARRAVDVYVHRLCASIASMAASLEGLDVLVFTGGVGENAWPIRQRVGDRLGFLGIQIDAERNRTTASDADIATPGATVRCLVIASREDVEIAREVRRVLTD